MKKFAFVLCTMLFVALIFSCTKKTDTTTQNGCGLPTGLSYSSLTDSTVTLGWKATTGAVTYTVQYRQLGASSWNTAANTVDSVALTGLTANTSYQWQVEAICASGISGYSAINTFKTDTIPVTTPPSYYVYATYRGQQHAFECDQVMGTSMGDLTSFGGTETSTGDRIGLTQTYLDSRTCYFNVNPSVIPNILLLVIGGVTYENNPNSSGSETRVLGGFTATVTFNGTIYNVNNAADSIVLTSGSFTGPYSLH